MRIVTVNKNEYSEEQKKYLTAVNQMYTIYIDSILMEKEFIYTTNKDKRFQFETFLDISSIDNGKHLLQSRYTVL